MGWHVDESLQGDTGNDLSKNTSVRVIQQTTIRDIKGFACSQKAEGSSMERKSRDTY